MVRIRGSYALAVMFQAYPGEIYVARKDSPMLLGVEDGVSYIASDVPAILKYTRNCIISATWKWPVSAKARLPFIIWTEKRFR